MWASVTRINYYVLKMQCSDSKHQLDFFIYLYCILYYVNGYIYILNFYFSKHLCLTHPKTNFEQYFILSFARCVSRLLFNESVFVCFWLLWPCQMAWWTAWIQTAVCRQPVTLPPCVWAPRIPWTSSRRHRCPLHRATYRLSMTGCASLWAGTAPT